ncbi:MAG: ribokinase [Acidimicrobiales bacterium]|nr:ribokinase [Acidimicrobiales bacterium]
MRIAVFGSANYDVSLWVPHLLAPDETLHATRLEEFCGGKGANQATAAARLGANVDMIACVGADSHGDTLVAGLQRNGVDTTHVHRVDTPTGMAFPIIAPEDVCIIIARGANGVTGPDHAEAATAAIAAADVLLLQGEVGGEGAGRAAEIARSKGTRVVFNPAPVVDEVVAAVLPLADVVIVNRQEHAAVRPPHSVDVVLTLGADGAVVQPGRPDEAAVAAFPTTVVDPTGAGDAFCAALAVALAEGTDLAAAARFGCAAGALAVRVAGAEPSMPTRPAVDDLLAEHGGS